MDDSGTGSCGQIDTVPDPAPPHVPISPLPGLGSPDALISSFSSYLISFPFCPATPPYSCSPQVGEGELGRGGGGHFLTPAPALRSAASPRPSPRTAVRWGTCSPSASTPSTPSWTPGSSSSSARPSSSASSSGSAASAPGLPTATRRHPSPSLPQGGRTQGPLPLSGERRGAGCLCQPGARGKGHACLQHSLPEAPWEPCPQWGPQQPADILG